MLNFDRIEDAERWWRLSVRRPMERLQEVVHGGLLLGTVVLAVVLGFSPQGRELFRVLLERLAPVEIGAAVAGAAILSGLLFFTYRRFLPYLGEDSENDSSSARVLAAIGHYVVTAAPWLACLASVWGMRRELAASRARLEQEVADAGLPAIAEQGKLLLARMMELESHGQLAMLAITALGFVTLLLLGVCDGRERRLLRRTVSVLVSTAALVVVAVVVIAAATDWLLVGLFQFIGPLAAGLLAAVAIFRLALFLGSVGQATGLAGYVTLLLALLYYWVGVVGSEALMRTRAPQREAAPAAAPFANQVDAWMAERRKQEPARRQAPLIVASAQGGGMYAAIATSLFLARLQDRDPGFNRALLAVSAVSGGAIGAALYDALAAPGGCSAAAGTAAPARSPIEPGIKAVLLHSHLAPIIGNAPTDVLRKLLPFIAWSATDRADALSESLKLRCPALAKAYAQAWTPASSGPALVLNTTWMSNGHRVAFAPFPLRAVGDGTLWSFADVYSSAVPLRYGVPFDPTMADAAVASARFPGLLPPLSLTMGHFRHNYGDGGYADASGLTTGLELFDVARAAAGQRMRPILLMLTFDHKEATPQHSGTAFVETIAPVESILGVRENLAGKAITRAINLYEKDDTGAFIARVSLDPDAFGLALGLQLSEVSFDVLSLLVGRPEWCTTPSYRGPNTILRNSCAARRVLDALRTP